mgnify:FL=1
MLKNFLNKIYNSYLSTREIRKTVKELNRLTNKELNDIGISRGDIYSVARKDVDMNPNLRGWV